MKLLVIVLCLLSERFLIHSISYQRFNWFDNYAASVKTRIASNDHFANPWLQLLALIVPILIPVAIIYVLLHNIFFGFTGLLLSTAIFFYCLGPQNAFYPVTAPESGDANAAGSYFAQVNGQLFAVIFWYIFTGPIGVLAYRLITLCRNDSAVTPQAQYLTDILEWIPARVTALLYLLVGNFQRGLSVFVKYSFAKPELNNQLLSECGSEAVKMNESDDAPVAVAENLVELATIVLLVFIALFTLVAWL